MTGLSVSYGAALGAGFLSFASPCVLPLVPAYLCFLGGCSLDQLTAVKGAEPHVPRRVLAAALAFVLGFGLVFVALGAGASAVSALLIRHLDLVSRVGAGLIVLFGLHFMGVLRIPFLYREARFHLRHKPAGPLGAFLMGMAFAFGWSPCVGPILATILMVAATGTTAWYGVGLLAAYAVGLGIPFLLAAAASGAFMRFLGRFRHHLGKVELGIGGLLVLTGVLIFTGSLPNVSAWLLDTFPVLGRIG